MIIYFLGNLSFPHDLLSLYRLAEVNNRSNIPCGPKYNDSKKSMSCYQNM